MKPIIEQSNAAPSWNEFLAGHERASICHDPRWGGVMQSVYGNRPYYLTAKRDGEITGVVQIVEQRSLAFGAHGCSLPYFDASGILCTDDESRQALLEQLRQLRREMKVRWIELRDYAQTDPSLPERTDKLTMQLDLCDDPDELWSKFKPKVRNLIRKAEKADAQTAQGGAELLDEFFGVYLRNMRDLGSPPHSKRFFRAIIDAFGDAVRLFVVRQEGNATAASFTLCDRATMWVPWAGTDWRYRQSSPSMLQYWEMLAEACRRGMKTFDFGRCTVDSGTYRFKKQWEPREIPLVWQFVMDENDALPDLRHDSPSYRMMTAAWKRLPLWAAATLGPRIISKVS